MAKSSEVAMHHIVVSFVATACLACISASAEQVVVSAPITNFAPTTLGGIRTIVRYAVTRPDRSEIDYLLLGEPSGNAANAAPVAIQVEESNGNAVTLSDVEGADCTLTRTAIIRAGRGVVLIRAARADDVKQVLEGSLSQPGPMEIRMYRRRIGGDAGESSPVFTADTGLTRTKPVCSEAEVQQSIDAAARSIHENGTDR